MYRKPLVNDPMFTFLVDEQIHIQSEMKSIIEKLQRLGRDKDAETISEMLDLSEKLVCHITAEEVQEGISVCEQVDRFWTDYPELMSEVDRWVESGDLN